LFTSGSTGFPKGVPISVKNLNAFIEGFQDIYPDLTFEDRFLQTYELTSDAAFTGYLIPLLLGATVFTIPGTSIKYLAIVKILQEYQITWTQFTPSVLNYLRPYLKSLRFDHLKHSHFGGEALPFDLVNEWAQCVPNAEISNIYGPTETTITCTILRTPADRLSLHVHNKQISIGKPIKDVKILIIDDHSQILPDGEKGELCIGGPQVMESYLQPKGTDPFLVVGNERYYRSGDMVFVDKNGFLMFCGRKDDQMKINGYRIEPVEIELAISRAANGLKCRVFGFKKQSGMEAMVAFVEKYDGNPVELQEKLREFLAPAFIPEKIISIGQFPLNTNGKVDKLQLFHSYSSQMT
jgi:acyl-coenzyme A synthetase/AMP-(fatty) acid ligase